MTRSFNWDPLPGGLGAVKWALYFRGQLFAYWKLFLLGWVVPFYSSFLWTHSGKKEGPISRAGASDLQIPLLQCLRCIYLLTLRGPSCMHNFEKQEKGENCYFPTPIGLNFYFCHPILLNYVLCHLFFGRFHAEYYLPFGMALYFEGLKANNRWVMGQPEHKIACQSSGI